MVAIDAAHICVTRNGREILHDLSFTIETGSVVSVIGPNGCGKSTLLKAMARMLPLASGHIAVSGKPLSSLSRKELAREIAVLTQFHRAPEDMTVRDLVRLGRFPYETFYSTLTEKDMYYIRRAMESTHVMEYADVPVQHLSGGEQQRVWLAMLLAQRSPVLLLDEPGTYLDMRHQLYLMKLLRHCNEKLRLTIVIVLHDMNQALRYTDNVLVMQDGRIIASGAPMDVITPPLVRQVFGVETERICASDGTPALVTLHMC